MQLGWVDSFLMNLLLNLVVETKIAKIYQKSPYAPVKSESMKNHLENSHPSYFFHQLVVDFAVGSVDFDFVVAFYPPFVVVVIDLLIYSLVLQT